MTPRRSSAIAFAAGFVVAAGLAYLGATDANYAPRCIVIASDADHGPRLAGRYDFSGGVWTERGTARVLGYSKHEDSVIYNSAQCAQNGAS